jgi:NodT family efflux transporter outer membrane factor (OMF) lipoprotein
MIWGMALTGCSVGPDFKSPAPPVVQNYTAAALPAQTASAPIELGGAQHFMQQVPIGTAWWRQFGSSELNRLVDQALQSSPTLEAAQATLRQAEETYNAQAGSTLYPQVGVGLGGARERYNAAGLAMPISHTFDLYNASVDVSYNLDLSGGNRRTLEALAAQADYQRFQFDGARLTVAANVVTSAFAQAQLSAQIMAVEQILAAQTEQLHLIRQRLAMGNASDADVLILQTQVKQTRASILPMRNRLEQINHLLAILVGQPPGAASMPQFALTNFYLPTDLPLHIPSELVRQRPDIQASEALLHVANAQYGVAVSRFYPQLTLSASMGSLTNAVLFNSASGVWGLAGQLTQPLFNAGLRPGARAAKAGFNAAAANYRQTVLQALRNVADVLRALDNDAQALQAQADANALVRHSLELVQTQYRLGVDNYLQVLTAQQQVQQTNIDLITIQAQRLADTAALYQAMGGGHF